MKLEHLTGKWDEMKIKTLLAENAALRISLAYLVLGGCWILFSDKLLGLLLPDLADLSALQTAKGLGFIAVTAYILFQFVSAVGRSEPSEKSVTRRSGSNFPLALFVLSAFGIVVVGWLTYSTLRTSLLHEETKNLTAIGELKAQQIKRWVDENVHDGELLTINSVLAHDIAVWMADGAGDTSFGNRLDERLKTLADSSHYTEAILYDVSGKPVHKKGLPDAEVVQHRLAAMNAMEKRRALLVDFHAMDIPSHRVALGIASPVMDRGKVVGAIYFAIDPDAYLYPVIQDWPIPSASAETLMVRRDGAVVTFLNPLRHSRQLPLTMTLPMANTLYPTVQAVLGRVGLLEGIDYRGVDVLAYLVPIEGTGWKLVAKIDQSEALANTHYMTAVAILLGLLLLIVSGALSRLWWLRELAYIAVASEAEKRALSQHYDYLSKYANDIILLADESGHVLEANEHALQVYGYPRDEFIGLSVSELRADSCRSTLGNDLASIIKEKSRRYEVMQKTRDGREFPVEVNARVIEQEGRCYLHAVMRDISERKEAEQRVTRMNLFYQASAMVNEMLVRHWREPESTLMNETCRIAVEHRAMKMAWMGKLNEASGRIEPVASVGEGCEFLQEVVISADANIPEGRGPTGTALRENIAVTVNDYMGDVRTAVWHERAMRYGWASSAAFPIRRNGKPYAVLTMYNGDKNAFDEQTVTLMMEMASNIEFALDVYDTEQLRNELQMQLAHVLEVSPACIYTLKPDPYKDGGFHVSFISPNIEKLAGYPVGDWLTQPGFWAQHLHPDDRAAALAAQETLLSDGKTLRHHYRFQHADGSYVWINDQLTLLRDAQGRPVEIIGAWTDTTQLMQAQQLVQQSEQRFRAYFERSMVGMATTSLNKGWLDVNPALCELLGYPREMLVQKTWAELTHPDDLAADVAQFNRVIAGEIDEYSMDKRFIRGDGEIVHTYMAVRVVRKTDGSIDYFVALVDDISDRKLAAQVLEVKNAELQALVHKLEEFQNQLLQSEKMASIGLLAAGVAHEINNPIAYVFSNLGTLEKYLADFFALIQMYETQEPQMSGLGAELDNIRAFRQKIDLDFLKQDARALLGESREGLERVKKIILDLKDFSRAGQDEKWELANLHTGLESTLNVVWNELKYKCEVKKEFGDLPLITCLPQQLNQVFMNLLVNAAQAIETRGIITLRTGHQGDQVWVEVEDNGKGIPPEAMGKIFDPFFTTKPVGKGTGLGLSVSFSIVEKHHGKFEVKSEVGRGTTFRVTLPVSRAENQ